MLLIIVVAIAIGAFAGNETRSSGTGFIVGGLIAVVVGLLVSVILSVKVIQPGEAGVQLAFGSFCGDPLPNGTHLVKPWAQVIKYTTKVQEYTMGHSPGEGQKANVDDSIGVLCKDRLQMSIDATCFWTVEVSKLNWIHANLGPNYVQQFLRPLIRKVIPEVFGEYDAMEVSTTGREEAMKACFDKLKPEFEKMGMNLTEVNLRHIRPPDEVLNAIAAKLAAVETAKKAEFDAQGTIARAKGEAEANRVRQTSLTPLQVQWEQIQAWKELAKSSNAKVIIPMGGSTNILVQP